MDRSTTLVYIINSMAASKSYAALKADYTEHLKHEGKECVAWAAVVIALQRGM